MLPNNKYHLHQLATANTPPASKKYIQHQTTRLKTTPNLHPIPTWTPTTYPRKGPDPSACNLVLSRPYFIEQILLHNCTMSASAVRSLLACIKVSRAFAWSITHSRSLRIASFKQRNEMSQNPRVFNPLFFIPSDPDVPIYGGPGDSCPIRLTATIEAVATLGRNGTFTFQISDEERGRFEIPETWILSQAEECPGARFGKERCAMELVRSLRWE